MNIQDHYTDNSILSDTSLTGPLRYRLTNDFFFKYIMQENLYACKGLLCALLDIPEDAVCSIEILNPISLGQTPDDKDYVLDLKLKLNSNQIINIEMQVAHQNFWPERSLIYLGRCFDQLRAGDKYSSILPCIQIGILDKPLFAASDIRYTDDFYLEYRMKEHLRNTEYSSKFSIRVLQLAYLKNAHDKDSPNSLYRWAKLFKAATWEDLKMITADNKYMKSTIGHIRVLSADEKLAQECEAREKYYCDMASAIDDAVAQKDKEIAGMNTLLMEKDSMILRLKNEIERLKNN